MPGIVMVLTRDLSATAQSGREKTLASIKACLHELDDVVELKVENALEDSRLFRWLYVLASMLWGWLRGRPEPLQCLLFRNPRALTALAEHIRRQKPSVVYFDSIRSAYFALEIRKLFPSLRLVTDLDDLMSRRYAELRETGFEISIGYLERYLPSWVKERILNGVLRSLVLRYEAWSLSRVENQVVDAVDVVTLVSSVEVAVLRQRLSETNRSKVHWIPPSHRFVTPHVTTRPPLRFIFIGSDSLLQNRLTIDWLLDAWQTIKPNVPLHIFGRMRRSYPAIEGVRLEGFAESLSSVYTPTSIMLAPSFVAGGVKTKLVEALAAGVLVVGNTCSFEGLSMGSCRLALSDQEAREFIREPLAYLNDLIRAATQVQEELRQTLEPTVIKKRWAAVLDPQSIA